MDCKETSDAKLEMESDDEMMCVERWKNGIIEARKTKK